MSTLLSLSALLVISLSILSYFYGDMHYQLPDSPYATDICLFGFVVGLFGWQTKQQSDRWSDKAENISLFAKRETAEIQFERALVRACATFTTMADGSSLMT